MKPKIFKHNGITLEKDKGKGWWLSVGFQRLAIEESEISDIADVCVEMLISYSKSNSKVKMGIAE